MDIVSRTLQFLESMFAKNSKIAEIHLTRYFTTVELSDGSVGACMSYFKLEDPVLKAVEFSCLSSLTQHACSNMDSLGYVVDNCIATYVADEPQQALLRWSIQAALASALSAPVIRTNGDSYFSVSDKCPGWHGTKLRALVVGFGGFLPTFLKDPTVDIVNVIDLTYPKRRSYLDSIIARYRSQFPMKTINLGTSIESPEELRTFDLVSITGSTLCNGTLEPLLLNSRGDATIILQGQSASMHPRFLFEAGVKWIATTLKPIEISRVAAVSYDGSALKPILEGGLPWIYLLPRGISCNPQS